MAVNEEYLKKIVAYVNTYGEEQTAIDLNLKQSVLERYLRRARQIGVVANVEAKVLSKIQERYTKEELVAISNGGRIMPGIANVPIVSFEGQHIRIGAITDTHIGHQCFEDERLYQAFEEFKKEKVDFITHSGDVTEGMSTHPGQIYELSHIGYDAQKKHSVKLFGQWNDSKIYAIDGNHDCLDSETELLTKRGWVKYDSIQITDHILSYDATTKNAVWNNIDEIIVQDRDEELVSVETNSISMLVTKKHRVLCNHKLKDKYDKGVYVKADDLSGRIQLISSSTVNNEEFTSVSDEFIQLTGWLLSDGSISRSSETESGRYAIYQSKSYTEITKILDKLGYSYSISTRDRDIKQVCGRTLIKKPLPENCISINGGCAKLIKPWMPDKNVQPWMFNLSKRQFDLFLSSFIDGDGSRYNHTTRSFILYGTNKVLGDIQALCSCYGYRTTLKTDNRGAYRLNVTAKVTSSFDCYITKKYKQYEGKVWCLSVPLTNFMVRRNGTTYFTGNCWYAKTNGAVIVKDIAKELPNFEYIGSGEGDISLNGKASLKLWHGGDGSSYALSYRLQKIVESFSGGEKPNVLFAGHVHKYVSIFERNVYALSVGCMERQTSWMRGKKLSAHVGFCIVDIWVNKQGVCKMTNTWYPFYT